MSNARFTTQDAVVIMKHLRTQVPPMSKNSTVAYEICAAALDRQRGTQWRVGHYVAEGGILKPIPGAISSYDEAGKPVIAVPLAEPEPSRRKLLPITIDSLVDADGDVTEAETHDDNDEVVQAESEEPTFDEEVESARAMMHDPESIPDHEVEELNSESPDSETEDCETC